MGRPRKSGPPARVQLIVARNLDALLNQRYVKHRSKTAQERAFAKDAQTSLSQIQRARSSSTAIGIDVIERMADVLSVRVADMVTEGYFAQLSPAPPQATAPGTLQRTPRTPAALSRS